MAALHQSVCLFDPKACRLSGPPLCPAAEHNSTAAIRVPDWAAEGLEVRIGNLDSPLSAGLTWVDANTDADLAQIVWPRGEATQKPVVWTGSGGLARAAAGSASCRARAPSARQSEPSPSLQRASHPQRPEVPPGRWRLGRLPSHLQVRHLWTRIRSGATCWRRVSPSAPGMPVDKASCQDHERSISNRPRRQWRN